MNRGSRASQVVYLVHLQQNRLNDVVPYQLELRVPVVMDQVLFPTRKKVVYNYHTVPSLDQTVHEVATHEPGAARHHYPQTFLL